MDDVCNRGVDTGAARATGLIGGTGSIGISAPLALASWVISASVRLRKTAAVSGSAVAPTTGKTRQRVSQDPRRVAEGTVD